LKIGFHILYFLGKFRLWTHLWNHKEDYQRNNQDQGAANNDNYAYFHSIVDLLWLLNCFRHGDFFLFRYNGFSNFWGWLICSLGFWLIQLIIRLLRCLLAFYFLIYGFNYLRFRVFLDYLRSINNFFWIRLLSGNLSINRIRFWLRVWR